MKKTLIAILTIFTLISCEKGYESPEIYLDLYSDQLEYNGDVYIFDYPDNADNSYFKIDYNSLPSQRIYWSSPDSFYVVMFSDTMWTPVVDFSTYADDNGIGHQLVYVNQQFLGDTLNIIGTIHVLGEETIQKEILIKVEQND